MIQQKCGVCGSEFLTKNQFMRVCYSCMKKKAESWTENDLDFIRIQHDGLPYSPLYKVVGYDKDKETVDYRAYKTVKTTRLSNVVVWVKCCDKCNEDCYPEGKFVESPARILREKAIERCPKCGRYVK